MARISVFVSPELQALLGRLRQLPADARKEVRRATKQSALPIWRQEVDRKADTAMEARVFASTARIAVTDKGVLLQSARIGKPLRGGFNPRKDWASLEFGSLRGKVRDESRTSPRGTRYTAHRHTQRQLPGRKKAGHVVFSAFADAAPRLMSLWLQTVVRAGHEALEGRR